MCYNNNGLGFGCNNIWWIIILILLCGNTGYGGGYPMCGYNNGCGEHNGCRTFDNGCGCGC